MRFPYTMHWDRTGRWRPRTVEVHFGHPDPDDLLMRAVAAHRCFYEIDLLEYIAVRGPAGGVFLDVGANIGNHAVFFGLFLADHVIAVEPAPETRTWLARNLASNGIEQCTIVPCGVAARAGHARLVVPAEHPHNLGAVRLAPADDGAVELTTIDKIARGHDVRFLKLDVEGMEREALEGAARLLEEQRPQLCVELATREQYESIAPYLARFGYEPRARFCVTPTWVFADPGRHPPRRRPAWWRYRLVRSWTRGALARWRRRAARP